MRHDAKIKSESALCDEQPSLPVLTVPDIFELSLIYLDTLEGIPWMGDDLRVLFNDPLTSTNSWGLCCNSFVLILGPVLSLWVLHSDEWTGSVLDKLKLAWCFLCLWAVPSPRQHNTTQQTLLHCNINWCCRQGFMGSAYKFITSMIIYTYIYIHTHVHA